MARARRGEERYLTTVLFTDIVDSTRLAGELGDRAWRDLVEQHHELIRRQLRRFGGRLVDTAGDGTFATFDAPARAVAFALTIVSLIPELGLQVRAGIHTGEVEEAGGKLRGIAVHIGSRIGAAAEAGEVLTSATVRDLVAGSGVEFEDRGVHELKGVAGEWHLFRAARGARFDEQFGAAGAAAGRDVAAVRSTVQRRRRRRRLIVAAALMTVVAVIAATVFVATRPPPSLPAVDANNAALIDPASGRIIAQVGVGTRPDGVAAGEGAVWIANTSDDTVSRIDPSTHLVVQTIDVGGAPRGVAVGSGSVWVADSDDRTVSRINAATNRVVQTITVGNGPTGVAFGAGSVWVTNSIDGTVSRIDATSGGVTGTFVVGAAPSAVAADDTSVWVADSDLGRVSRLDPSSGTIVASVGVGNGPRAVAIAAGAVWVANEVDGTVSRVDPASGRVTATIEVGQGSSGVAGSGETVWVASALDGALFRIDPATNVAIRTPIGAAPEALAIAGDQLWLSARASATSHRGGRLLIVASDPLISIDPALSSSADIASILGMTNDGLVAFQRTGGIAGSTIVPDLATSLPQPADGGKTYTFQLRSGLTYSDGRPIKPEDFRYAIERVFAVPRDPDEAAVGGAQFYGEIVGADECAKHFGEACDLSAGIVTDPAGGSVTFHLTGPDPDFLQKLALSFAVATPASVGGHDVRDQPIPATGAYMVASFSPAEVRIVRNPRFQEWSRLARPDGYPDEMLWTTGVPVADQLDRIIAGSADATVGSLDLPDPKRVGELLTRYPSQVHSSIVASFLLFMNTTVAPFDDVGVRRALNFALDRARIVELMGGATQAELTCQLIAPNTPGYEPYCPYTVSPNPGGTWIGPDVAAARDLVTASGRAGTKVTVWNFGLFPEVGTYLAQALTGLGFPADVHQIDDFGAYYTQLVDPVQGPKIQAVVMGYFGVLASASDVIVPMFPCDDPNNFARFCDASVNAKIQAALALEPTDPAAARQAWAAIDRAIVDLAPAAPLAHLRSVDIVSARVGNYQHHPQSGVLYDQLWVQ